MIVKKKSERRPHPAHRTLTCGLPEKAGSEPHLLRGLRSYLGRHTGSLPDSDITKTTWKRTWLGTGEQSWEATRLGGVTTINRESPVSSDQKKNHKNPNRHTSARHLIYRKGLPSTGLGSGQGKGSRLGSGQGKGSETDSLELSW